MIWGVTHGGFKVDVYMNSYMDPWSNYTWIQTWIRSGLIHGFMHGFMNWFVVDSKMYLCNQPLKGYPRIKKGQKIGPDHK